MGIVSVSTICYSFSFLLSLIFSSFFYLRVWRWNRMDIISTIKHFFHEFITFKFGNSYLLDNNSKSEILLSDIKDYAIIPLGSLDYSSNAFINITSLIRSSANGLG